MDENNLSDSYNDLLERYNSLSSSYNKIRAQAELDTSKAKRTMQVCKSVVFILVLLFAALAGILDLTNSKADYKLSTQEYNDLLEETQRKAHENGYQEGYNAGKAENAVQFYAADESPWGDGYDAGYAAGYIDGSKYLETVASTEISKEADTTNYDTGYSDGYTQGYEEGAASVAIADSEATSEPSSASNDTSTPQVVETPAPVVTTYDYIINTRTGKFHYSWCSSVGQMKESNKWYYNGTHDDVVNMGYVPCQRCCP